MIPDTNSITEGIGNVIVGSVGGDMIFLALLFLFLISFVFIKGRVRASGALAIGACIILTFALVAGTGTTLMPAFWIIVLAAGVFTVIGLLKFFSGRN